MRGNSTTGRENLMNATLIIILVIAAVVVVALVVAAVTASRRRALRERFGPEYDRVVADKDSKRAAERELRDRERRHAELELKPLSPESKARYAEEWTRVQAQFVDAPEDAVRAGDALVTRLLGEIGYPTDNYDDQLATPPPRETAPPREPASPDGRANRGTPQQSDVR